MGSFSRANDVTTTDFMKDDNPKAEEIAQFVQSNRERIVIAI